MRDPIPQAPPYLVNLVKPVADALHLHTLPFHMHEVIFAFIFYQSIQSIVSPILSAKLFPSTYPQLKPRTKLNWDVHVVSLVQSCLINVLALWVMFTDNERSAMRDSVVERIYGYTGAGGFLQGMAAGYFLWDLIVSTRYLKIFGFGILAHAITALSVFSFGFRPFVNYYSPVFILYELSTPFLNVHWFCDKLNLTGSKIQWYNGLVLLATFFGCRLIWGTYSSLRVYQDVWHILHLNSTTFADGQTVRNPIFSSRDGQLCLGKESCVADQAEVMRFVGQEPYVPAWLCVVYLVANLTLNSLNFYWFGKMIETIRKRFDGSSHEDQLAAKARRQSVVEEAATKLNQEVLDGPATPYVEKKDPLTRHGISTGVQVDGDVSKRRS